MGRVVIILSFGVFLALIAVGIVQQTAPKAKTLHARLGSEALLLEVADTEKFRIKGLSGHAPLASHEGMLFVFSESAPHGFWMKDMQFPIDILWLDEEYRILDTEERVAPESYPNVFSPSAPARFVLELPAGFFAHYGLRVGDILKILK